MNKRPTILYERQCPNCRTVFTYTKKDVEPIETPRTADNLTCVVVCPQCGAKTFATFIRVGSAYDYGGTEFAEEYNSEFSD